MGVNKSNLTKAAALMAKLADALQIASRGRVVKSARARGFGSEVKAKNEHKFAKGIARMKRMNFLDREDAIRFQSH